MSHLTASVKAFEVKIRNSERIERFLEHQLIAELAALVMDLSVKVDRLGNVEENLAPTDIPICRSFSAAYSRMCSTNGRQDSGL